MKPRIQLDTAPLPDGGQLQLFKRDTEYSIMLGNIELMNSRLSKSEEALATVVCERLKDIPSPKLLIGGLGMGFTLRAALRTLGPDAKITVAELVPDILTWAKAHMADIYGDCLEDRRLSLAVTDVAEFIFPGAAYDAILLDVDNGPEGLVQESNNALYKRRGLLDARDALKPGGILAVWSITGNIPFTNRLKRAGFSVEEQIVRAHGTRHVVWLATKMKG